MDADDLLRETFAEHAEAAPRADGLAAAVRRRAARNRRQGWAVVGAAATAVAALAVAAVAFVPGAASRRPATTEPLTQRIYQLGIEAYVPAGWPVDLTRCGTPLGDTVVTHGSAYWCFADEPPRLTVAYLLSRQSWGAIAARLDDVRSRDETLSGHAAMRVTGREPARDGRPARHVAAVVVPDMQVAFWVLSPDADLAARIAATVRVVDADWQGCGPRLAPPLYATERAARPGAAEAMVPAGPVAATACQYDLAGDIVHWHALDATEIADAVRVLNTLPPGYGDPPPRENKHCEDDRLAPMVFTFHYASGPDVVVYVHLTGCEHLGASNGTVRGGHDGALVLMARRLAGFAESTWTHWSEEEPTS